MLILEINVAIVVLAESRSTSFTSLRICTTSLVTINILFLASSTSSSSSSSTNSHYGTSTT